MKTKAYITFFLLLFSVNVFAQFKVSLLKNEQIQLMKKYKVLSNNPPINIANLRNLTVDYYNFDGKIKQGELVVHATIATALTNIFKELLKIKFPINRVELVEQLFISGGNDPDIANITSSFYDRNIDNVGVYHRYDKIFASRNSPKSAINTIISLFNPVIENKNNNASPAHTEINSSMKSLHAYGFAIDINPIQNPIIYFMAANQIKNKNVSVTLDKEIDIIFDKGIVRYFPYQGIRYANRKQKRNGLKDRQGMVEEVVEIFLKHGMNDWGGDWDMPIDYMHFQIPKERALILEEIANTESLRKAIDFFNTAKKYYNMKKTHLEAEFSIPYEHHNSLLKLYQKNPTQFYSQLEKLVKLI
ncbi:MAG: M15 family metallopeptidase [Legionellales bacterium]|nr:M15 family metallopeptidase [Legionellales bacterium]